MEIILHHDSFEQKRISALVISSLASTEILFHSVFLIYAQVFASMHGFYCLPHDNCGMLTFLVSWIS